MSNQRIVFRWIGLILFFAIFVAFGQGTSVLANTAVFINEIHYDNSGTDTGEAIEVAGPAGTDLTGWSIVLYNGANGAVYDTDALAGVLPNQQNGFGTVFIAYPSNGIQNGSPDGLALVDNLGAVVQFLSYEGTFMAVGGPADSMTSTDIGVSQSGSGAVGNSLQLMGTGSIYEDFTWAAEGPHTFGQPNTGQTFAGGPVAPDVNISEIRIDQPSTDNDEYFELAAAPGTALDGLTYLVIGDGAAAAGSGVVEAVVDLTGQTVGGSGFFVVAETTFGLGTADLTANLNFENSDNVTHLLVDGFSGADGDDLDTNDDGVLDLTPWTSIVDLIALIVQDNPPAGTEYHYGPPTVGPDGSFVPGHAFLCDDGWHVGAFDPAGGQDTPAAANDCAVEPSTDVIINEADSDTPGTDALEFVELYDGGAGATTLDGLVVVFYNGSNDLSYAAFDLDGQVTDANGYFLLGNAAVSPTPGIIFAGNFLQNGQDAVALYVGNGSDFPSNTPVTTSNLLDAIVYDTSDPDDPGLLVLLNPGQPQVDENGNGNSASDSNQRCPNGEGGGRNTDTYTQAAPTPGAENECDGGGGDIGACGDPATFIHEVQGSGLLSPLVGMTVNIEGVVVGDFQNNAQPDDGDLNGFHVQEEDSDADGDPATSEGIFVFAAGTDVNVGDQVRVRGTVVEFSSSGSSMTELSSVSDLLVCATGAALPAPTDVTLPVADISDFERYEGMLVRFPQQLVIAEFFNFDRFNEMVLAWPLAGQDRLHQPTAVAEPGSPEAAAIAQANLLSRITLDDGRSSQNPDPALHPNGSVFDLNNLFRGGDIVQDATGVIDHTFGLYRIHPTQGATHSPQNPRPEAPDAVGGSLKVASFNVLNYFTTIDDGQFICGPAGNQECRGADTPEEFERQRIKIIAALVAINADVVGLIEIENNASASVADLVNGLNDALGAGTYGYIDTGTIGTDAIKVAIIYKPATVSPVGAYAILDSTVDPRFVDTLSRPVLAQTFREHASGGMVTVAVNHLKSKGSGCGPGDDDPQQGNCNGTRTLAAEAQVDWLATDPTNSGDPDFLIMGDLNAYDKEDPIDAIVEGADDSPGSGDDYSDLVALFGGEFAYSYLFDGQLGYLDHALAIDNLVPQITGVTVWHINADEPDLLDYDMTFKQDAQDALFEPNAFRSSDHDPVIVGLDLNGPPDCSGAHPNRATLWPPNHEFVAITIRGVTDPDGDPVTIIVTGIFQDEAVDAPDSGNTSPDGAGVGMRAVKVRAERVGDGNGRVYHIYFTADDGQGNSCAGEVLVSVPISLGGGPAIDDGPLYDSTVAP